MSKKLLPEHVELFTETYCLEHYVKSGVDTWWWYRRFAKFFLDSGIPEEGVINLMKKHQVPAALIRRYGRSTGLVPETVAANILKNRHVHKDEYSSTFPKIRITKKRISDYRNELETEIRRLWARAKRTDLEEVLGVDCYGASDEHIVSLIERRWSPETAAKSLLNTYEYL